MNNERVAQGLTAIIAELRPEDGYKPNTQYILTAVFQTTINPPSNEPTIDFVISPPEEIKHENR